MPAPLMPMRGEDAIWLQDSPDNLMVINALLFCDAFDLETFLRVWNANVMQARNVQGEPQYDRFTKRVILKNQRFYWQEDEQFAIQRHIFSVEDRVFEDDASLQQFVGEEAGTPLSYEHPLWQIRLLQGWDDQTILFVRIHHCMGDGVALIPILFSLLDEMHGEQEREKVNKPLLPPLVRYVMAPIAALPVLISRLLWIPDRSMLRGARMTGRKRVAWSPELSLEEVKQLKNALQGTVNDVLMGCVAGAFHRYLARQSPQVPTKVRTSMPVNLRTIGEEIRMQNDFTIAFLTLPLHPTDPKGRMMAVKSSLDGMKKSLQPFIMFRAAAIVTNLLPMPLARFVLNLFANKTTAITTNVPGPQYPLHLAGRSIRAMLFWVPTRANVGIGISVLSLSGYVRLGVLGDESVLPDPEQFVADFVAEFETLKSLHGL